MKKISKELYRSYLFLIFIFIVSQIVTTFYFISYLNRNSSFDVKILDNFLRYEATEFDDEFKNGFTIEKIFDETLEESPKMLGISLIFKYEDKLYSLGYSKENLQKLEKAEFSDEIQEEGFYSIQFIKRKIFLDNYSPIEVYIIKSMEHERKIILNVLIVSTFLLGVTLLVSFIISKKFYGKFTKSLNNLQEITNEINLDNLNRKVENKNEYIEFEKIIKSYSSMLERLNFQTKSQIDFVNNASHELKTPIFVIGGYIKMIKRWGWKEEAIANESISAIESEVKNMSTLINKLLFLAKDEFHQLKYEEIDVNETIQEIVKELKIVYPEQTFKLSLIDDKVFSEEFLLRQLLINLIENAIKYGEGKEIEIQFLNNINEKTQIKIKDNGMGISQEDLKHIFDRFYRVDKARGRETGSHGLGLAIVKKIAQILEIDIKIESELGKGTCVTLSLK